MPELPEVETLKRELAKVLIGKTITKLTGDTPKMIAPYSLKQLSNKVVGKKITEIDRRAKVLIITLSDKNHLLIHLKMTGQLIFRPAPTKASKLKSEDKNLIVGGHPQPGGLDHLPNKFTRLVFTFKDGSVLYHNDMRKFGWAKLVTTKEKEGLLVGNGPEPLGKDFTLEYFKSLFKKYPGRKVKQILLDQSLIAGIGNIYADEAAYLAKILPMRQAKTLTNKELADLYAGIKSVLRHSISMKGTSAKNYLRSDGSKGGFVPHLNVYGRAKLPCKVCDTPITKIKLNGRGTHFCEKCQK